MIEVEKIRNFCSHLIVAILVFLAMKWSQAELINLNQNYQIQAILMHKRLNECAIGFGTYIATKGRYGAELLLQREPLQAARHQPE